MALAHRDIGRLLAPTCKLYQIEWPTALPRSEPFVVLAQKYGLNYTYWIEVHAGWHKISVSQQGSGNPPFWLDLPKSLMQALIWRNDFMAFLEKRASYAQIKRLGAY